MNLKNYVLITVLTSSLAISSGNSATLAAEAAIADKVPEITAVTAQTPAYYSLDFDASKNYAEEALSVNGTEVKFRAYRHVVYVANPQNAESQYMNIFIPAAYFEGAQINGYTKETAPIFMPNGVGGYMPGKAGEPLEKDNMAGGGANSSLIALSRGYVVAAPAIRGRNTIGEDGKTYVGKAPALIVDYKAAVRYLRYNKKNLPAGDTEKIISNGTSAGGALSALLGATGNAKEYNPYLAEIGAAEARDDIFASSDYCPITNLENADMAYEWMFNGVNSYYTAMWQLQDLESRGQNVPGSKQRPAGPPPKAIDADAANNPVASQQEVQMTSDEIAISKVLKDAFPAYVNSLKLKDENGQRLTLKKDGTGAFRNYIAGKYKESAQAALNNGTDVSSASWIKVENGKVTAVDLSAYPAAATRMKAAPAFDKLDLSSAENDEFGDTYNTPKHFSNISKHYEQKTGDMANSEVIKMMNPMNFIGKADTAKHFRIRHGALDRDTSLAIPALLALKLQNNGVDVNFSVPWGRGHSGDYDLPELFDWIDSICK
ncbi:subtype B tannase [Anaerovibrio lipolyticus]|uniref:subtype B tannase n=1 Tax=Anaerovibrio lipolyticus TaxID=82374 RepID=UPI0026F17E61|nr:subtype B tannase [Anaerovibrio lipolyticus]MBE6106002.1 alpha/beta hydrolase [Anaerovibrio lipolyticus]